MPLNCRPRAAEANPRLWSNSRSRLSPGKAVPAARWPRSKVPIPSGSLGYDILCFQKAFDGAAVEILQGALGEAYPYAFGPANDWFSLKPNSGVWVLSRNPLVNHAEIALAGSVIFHPFGTPNRLQMFQREARMSILKRQVARPVRGKLTRQRGVLQRAAGFALAQDHEVSFRLTL